MGKYLEKINFVNNKAPWINDINLNKLQDNFETAISEIEENCTTIVVDNLESTSETDALSANQGKVLKEKIENSVIVQGDTTQTNIVKRIIKHNNGEYEEYGVISNITVPLNNIKDVKVMFNTELIDTNYTVTYSPSAIVPFWTWARIVTGNKQKQFFVLRVGNDGTSEIPNLSVDYILKGRWK